MSLVVIFSDLDGTLLDHHSYSWKAAEPALGLIKKDSIPLIFCSSKTRTEIQQIREKLDNHDPFISENGGGIFIPENYFPFSFPYDRLTDGYQVIDLGRPYQQIRDTLKTIGQQLSLVLRGFGDMTVEEISSQTGLTVEETKQALQREYDEPFTIEGTQEQTKKVLNTIEKMGMKWTKGGRFYHLGGKSDKGKAALTLTNLFQKRDQKVMTIALGDNHNDFPMLKAVDYPILVQCVDGTFNKPPNISHVELAEGIGPIGWNAALLKCIPNLNKKKTLFTG